MRKLPAGSTLAIDAAGWDAAPRRYWRLAAVAPIDGDPVAHMRRALDEAITLTLRSDAPVGVALSGGLDSGVIAAMAARRRTDLTAFTVGYPGRRDFDERAAASELASTLGIPWLSAELPTSDVAAFFPKMVELLDEPIADVAAYGHYAVSKLAAAHGVKVLLTGIGGDELFFGYGWVRRAVQLSRAKLAALRGGSSFVCASRARLMRAMLGTPIAGLLVNHRLPLAWRQFVDGAFDAGRLDLDHPDEWVFYQLDYHWDPAVSFTAQTFPPPFASRLAPRGAYRLMAGLGDAAPIETSVAGLLFDSWLVSNCLDLGDRVSMASSVETRVPLLEPGLIDTALGLWHAGHEEAAQGLQDLAARDRAGAAAGRLRQSAQARLRPRRPSNGRRRSTPATDRSCSTARCGCAGVVDPDRLRLWERADVSRHSTRLPALQAHPARGSGAGSSPAASARRRLVASCKQRRRACRICSSTHAV